MQTRILVYIITGIIGLIIIPLLVQKGYMFAIDQVLNPHGWIPPFGDHIFWVGIFSQIFVYLHIPIWILEKFLICFTFILPALGGYLLLKDTKQSYAILFGVFLCIINPFLYARFLDGQINIYLSYALYPLFLYAIQAYFFGNETSKPFYPIFISLLSLFLCLTSVHNVIIIACIMLLLGVIGLGYRLMNNNLFLFKKYVLVLCSIIFINLIWFLPYIQSTKEEKFQLITQLEFFDQKHLLAFQNLSEDINIYREYFGLKGYWGEQQYRFYQNNYIGDGRKNTVIYFIWILVILGLISVGIRKKHPFEVFLMVLAGISYILALGINQNNIFSGVNQFLYDHLPLYMGFREPQKWIMFVVIFYAYFGALGIILIDKYLKIYLLPIGRYIVLITCSLIPIFYSFNMLFGFSGQISIKEYPQEWEQVYEKIKEVKTDDECEYKKQKQINNCYTTLSLPWHGYMGISWTQKSVGGWIVQYFGENILHGDNIEIGEVYSSSTRFESKIIEKYIGPDGILKKNLDKEKKQLFYTDIRKLGIEYIILLKEADYNSYLPIMKDEQYIEILEDNSLITLYKLKK